MAKLIYFPNSTIQKDNSAKKQLNVNQKLKLVVSNPCPASSLKPTISNASAAPSSCFTAEVCPRGPNLYEMHLQDSAYGLRCNLILEVECPHDDLDSTSIVCHFPNIDDRALNDFVEEDETLLGMFMIQFQMRILEQLFLFCANHYASNLVVFVDDVQADDLEIYRDFLTYKNETITAQGEKTEMIIPADRETFDAWIDFMEEATTKFHQTLWYEQKSNPIIREYLESYSLVRVEGKGLVTA